MTTICDGLRQDILIRGIPVERVTVVPNSVDIDEFSFIGAPDAGLKAELGLDGCFVLGFVGSFYGYEGLDLLVSALPSILEFEPTARLLLVGGGREERALSVQAERLGLRDRLVMVGRVPHTAVARYYGIIDLLVYPRSPAA